jgi:hypothetical protein
VTMVTVERTGPALRAALAVYAPEDAARFAGEFVLPVGDPRLGCRAPTRSTPRKGCGPVGLRQQPMIVS